MSGSHHAPAPLSLPPHLAAEGWQLHQPYDESTRYDLRTLTQQERDDIAALRACCDRLQDAPDYQTRRADAMAAELAAHRATLQRLADWAQVVELRRGVTP